MKIKLFEDFNEDEMKDWFVYYGLGGGINTKNYDVLEK